MHFLDIIQQCRYPCLCCIVLKNVHVFVLYIGNKLAVGRFIHGGEVWRYEEIRDLLKERYADNLEYALALKVLGQQDFRCLFYQVR